MSSKNPDRPLCPDCNRPLTVQVQSSGAIQHVCRTGRRHGDCDYSATIGGRLPGGQVKGKQKLTNAEKQKDYRRRLKDARSKAEE